MIRRLTALALCVMLPMACQSPSPALPPEAGPAAVPALVEPAPEPADAADPDEPALNEWGGEVPLSQPAGEVREGRLDDVL